MFWRKKRPLSDFEDEIESHLALEADALSENGAPRIDHHNAARRAFGNITSVKEAFYERGRWMLWDRFSRDVRHALRLCWRRPAFSAVVVLTLAVGIGATLAIFGIIDAVLLASQRIFSPCWASSRRSVVFSSLMRKNGEKPSWY